MKIENTQPIVIRSAKLWSVNLTFPDSKYLRCNDAQITEITHDNEEQNLYCQ